MPKVLLVVEMAVDSNITVRREVAAWEGCLGFIGKWAAAKKGHAS